MASERSPTVGRQPLPILRPGTPVDPIYGSLPRGQEEPVRIHEHGATGLCCEGRLTNEGSHARGLLSRDFDDYFKKKVEKCPGRECPYNKLDLWSSLREERSATADWVGARETSFSIPIAEGQNEVDLADYSVPADARIWAVWFGSQPAPEVIGEILKAEAPGDAAAAAAAIQRGVPGWLRVLYIAPPNPGEFPHVFSLLAEQPPTGEAVQSIGQINCTWVTTDDKPPPWQLLIEAVGSHLWGRDSSAVIWACTAVEAAVYELLSTRLARANKTEGQIKALLGRDATFFVQFDLVLPLVLSTAGLPPIDAELTSKLHRLRSLRNKLAHGSEAALDGGEVTRLIKATVFGLHFLRYVAERLDVAH